MTTPARALNTLRSLKERAARLLGVPLALKLAGANLVIVLTALGAALLDQQSRGRDLRVLAVLAVALTVGLAVNLLLLSLALRPIRMLERAAKQIWKGDLESRVPHSALADNSLKQLASTLNILLNGLALDRNRMRTLSAEIIRIGDRERANVSRQLHESLAQSLAALTYQLSAAERDNNGSASCPALQAAKETAALALEEIRRLSVTVHPRVLDDFGLVAGLRHLSKIWAESSASVSVHVAASSVPQLTGLRGEVAAVLYRVAEEAVSNAARHAKAERVEITAAIVESIAAGATPAGIWMEITDSGVGFDQADSRVAGDGTGLFVMQQRVALINGCLEIETAPGRGTVVRVQVPHSDVNFDPLRPLQHLQPSPPRLAHAG